MSITSTLRGYAADAESHASARPTDAHASQWRRWALTMREAADMIDGDTGTIDDLRQQVAELQALAGRHDPTGADHMEEMWVHAQRADAAEQRADELAAKVASLEEEELRLHDVIGELQMQLQFTHDVAVSGR